MATSTKVTATGNKEIDGLLTGSKWTGTVTYSFTDSTSDYGSYRGSETTASGFGAISGAQQTVVHSAMKMVGDYTNLDISFAGTGDSDVRVAQSSAANPTAFAYYPGSNAGGDVWFGTSENYRAPVLGDYYYLTHVHELGHAMGLKHSQEAEGPANTPLPSAHDNLEYTVMSYRSYEGGPLSGYTNEKFGYPTTYMMNDIRALQEMYGADYTTRSSNTVYKWSATTGEMFIDNVGQGAPGGAGAGTAGNVVFMTVWDGGGSDTYDFSGYTGGITVDLNPGAYSVTSAAQLASLGSGKVAHGNVYNAMLYKDDARSYIENAVGGTGADMLKGNAAANRLEGGAGNDKLTGGTGNDTFVFKSGFGADIVTDYSVGFDKVDLSAMSTFDSLSDVLAIGSQAGANAILNFGISLSLTLNNVALTALKASDFVFASGTPTPTPPNPTPTPPTPTPPTPTNPQPTPQNHAPTAMALDHTTIAENKVAGVVGKLTVSDQEDTAFTFKVSDKRFEVQQSGGSYVLKLAPGAVLDYESERSVNVAVTATDDGGLSLTKNFTLQVLDAADTPTVPSTPTPTGGVTITGTGGRDIIDGTHTVSGQAYATANADIIRAGGGDDVVYGLGGNDQIEGGAGSDRLYGGAGNDTFVVSGSDAQSDIMSGGDGTDTVQVSGTSPVTLARFAATGDSIEGWHGTGQAVLGSSGDNSLDFSGLRSVSGMGYVDASAGDDLVKGTFAADDLRGGIGSDTLYGNEGNDKLTGGAGADRMDGGAGNDAFNIGGTDAVGDIMRGGSGTDSVEVTGTASVTLSRFDADSSSIEGWHGNNAGVIGTASSDVIDFGGLTDVTRLPFIDAGAGNDRLVGSEKADDLRGGTGNDLLEGGLGNDRLTGGAGSDEFVFDDEFGSDVITDFVAGRSGDMISISGNVFGSLEDLLSASQQVGQNVVIDGGLSGTLTVQNVKLDDLNENNIDIHH